MIASVAAVMLFSLASQEAFAHGNQKIDVPDAHFGDDVVRQIKVVLGHNDEPTTAQEDGKSSGNHPMELFISDTRTGLNLSGAVLTVDKYFYPTVAAMQAEFDTDGEFTPLETGVRVGGVHGDPGHYFARQILTESGIYGYHVTGHVSYFGVINVPIDVMATCRDVPESLRSEFNTSDFEGGFGCTTDIDDGKFPAES